MCILVKRFLVYHTYRFRHKLDEVKIEMSNFLDTIVK